MIAITGVTGKLGSSLARQLAASEVAAKLLARRPEAAALLPNMTVHQAYYDTSQTTLDALSGVTTLFMVAARESLERVSEHKALIDAAQLAGVQHIIYTSFYQASETSTFTLARDHAETEAYIKEKGFTYTFIRDNFYLDFFLDLCRNDGEIKGPAANGRVSAVLREDVVGVAAVILQNPLLYANQVLNMTGPESLSLAEVAATVSKAWQKKIPYIDETIAEAYASRQAYPAQDWEYDSWVSTYTAIANGELAAVSHDIETILGRPATSLADYLKR